MNNLDLLVLELLNNEHEFYEICKNLNITPKKLLTQLKKMMKLGISFEKKYYDDGQIGYKINKNISFITDYTVINLKKDTYKFLAISDIHFGSHLEQLEYLDNIYNYAVANNIGNIINLGDLINGLSEYEKDINKIYKQVDRVVKEHPKDKNITNFILYGNHDTDVLKEHGINISKLIQDERRDLVTVGLGLGYLKIKNEKILLEHKSSIKSVEKKENYKIALYGHKHVAKIDNINGLDIYVPPLCNILTNDYSKPGAYLIEISFNNNHFSEARINQLDVEPNVRKINEMNFLIKRKKNI